MTVKTIVPPSSSVMRFPVPVWLRRKAAVGVEASMASREVGEDVERPRFPVEVIMSAVEVAVRVDVEMRRSGFAEFA